MMANAGTADLFAGIDVGTGSARAGLFAADGTLVAHAVQPISIWKEPGGIVEQSSRDIWRAVCAAMRAALDKAGASAGRVRGIGFAATCSMVIVGRDGQPLAASPGADPERDVPERDVIVWMDHRAVPQAERINSGGHDVLAYVGRRISPEMQTPKLLWLKENNSATFRAAGHFFDLADYLTWRATGSLKRSLCTVVCKWTYLGHENRWDGDYFRAIGLGELADEGFARIGAEIADIATPLAEGLTREAANDLGLAPSTPVGASLIDAHAGGVGTIAGASPEPRPDDTVLNRMALIMGTSACTLSVTREPAFVQGIWGPYFGAMLPGLWLNEGGQSAFGAAIDHLIALHPAGALAEAQATDAGISAPELLERLAVARAGGVEQAAGRLARDIHVVPEFLGNRAPEADPTATAVIAGLRLEAGIENLVELYVAGVCGLAYGTADILDSLVASNVPIRTIIVSGGAAKSALFRRVLADATGFTVALPSSPEPVSLGAAIIGAAASAKSAGKGNSDLSAVAGSMSALTSTTAPWAEAAAFHAAKRSIYRSLKTAERSAREIMAALPRIEA